jgi:hypothetical protein
LKREILAVEFHLLNGRGFVRVTTPGASGDRLACLIKLGPSWLGYGAAVGQFDLEIAIPLS